MYKIGNPRLPVVLSIEMYSIPELVRYQIIEEEKNHVKSVQNVARAKQGHQ